MQPLAAIVSIRVPGDPFLNPFQCLSVLAVKFVRGSEIRGSVIQPGFLFLDPFQDLDRFRYPPEMKECDRRIVSVFDLAKTPVNMFKIPEDSFPLRLILVSIQRLQKFLRSKLFYINSFADGAPSDLVDAGKDR